MFCLCSTLEALRDCLVSEFDFLSKGFVGGGAVWRSAERNEKDLNKE
jgi:hypothetical protein